MQIPAKQARAIIKGFGKGDVLRWSYFEFDKNKTKIAKDSYFILMSKQLDDGVFIAIRPTTQLKHYNSARNKIDTIILSAGESSLFPKETVVDLKQMIYLDVEKMVKEFGTSVKRLGNLENNIVSRLDRAVLNSKTVEQNIIQIILTSSAGSKKK